MMKRDHESEEDASIPSSASAFAGRARNHYSDTETASRPSSATTHTRRQIPRRRILALIFLGLAIVGFVSASYAFDLFGSRNTNCWARPSSTPNTAIFTIAMAHEGMNVGFNGSAYHSPPWPVMNVTLGQNVLIHVINNDSAEPHGFQISHYFTGIGGGLAPGKCLDVKFTANVGGSFLVFCDISCTIHLTMQQGRLNVL